MRGGLRALTTRGRALLAGGLAAAGAALVLGQEDVMRVAVFAVALPLVAVAVVARTRYRLSSVRRISPARVAAGSPTEVLLRLENVSRLPTGVLMLEDTLPYTLGGRPRFVLDRVAPQRAVEVRYEVRTEQRGRYQIGPLVVRLADPFGLAEVSTGFSAADTLVVTPKVLRLPQVRLTGQWGGTGDNRARSVSAAGEDDVTTRQYRHGDDLRRVHWRSTARYGELMVRREEQPWQSRAALLLDTRARAHRGEGLGSSMEWAVTAAASVGVHLSRGGYAVRYVDDAGTDVGGQVAGDQSFETVLLDALAVARPSRVASLLPAITTLGRGGGEGLIVTILGLISTEEAEQLARLRQHGATTGVAVMLDAAGWAGATPRQRAAGETSHRDACDVLEGAGWRVLRAGADTDLRDLWRDAGPMHAVTAPEVVA